MIEAGGNGRIDTMSYRIFTDATSDLPAEIAAELNVSIIPMDYTIDGVTHSYVPGTDELPIKTYYARMRAGSVVTTAQVNVFAFITAFSPILEGGEDILYIGFSSALSGTVSSARAAAEELQARFPARKVYVVDSLGASMGEGLYVYYAARKARDGMPMDELRDWLETNKLKFAYWFTVDDLIYLKRGGRVSGATAMIASVLNIKPVMHEDDEGKLVAVGKVQGRKRALRGLFEHMQESVDTELTDTAFLGHCDCEEDAKYVSDLINQAYPDIRVVTSDIGPVVGTHCGPGTVALFFIADKR